MVEPDYELVRVSRQLIDELLEDESDPVVVFGLERQEDGTCDLIVRRPELAVERDRYREALEEIARRPPVERNPDGVDQAAFTMQLIAREALEPVAPSPRRPER